MTFWRVAFALSKYVELGNLINLIDIYIIQTTLTKICDYLGTRVFAVVRFIYNWKYMTSLFCKKKIILHRYHHAVTLIMVWILTPMLEPVSRYYCFMNYGVHRYVKFYYSEFKLKMCTVLVTKMFQQTSIFKVNKNNLPCAVLI